jgi:single-strand DNA-binding protein
MNLAIIQGNVGNIELKYTAANMAIVTMTVATSEKVKDGMRTEWHRVTVFGKQAENCNTYLSKGSPVLVQGKIQTDSYENKDGNKVYTTKIVADNVRFLGKPNNESKQDKSVSMEQIQAEFSSFNTDEIPF